MVELTRKNGESLRKMTFSEFLQHVGGLKAQLILKFYQKDFHGLSVASEFKSPIKTNLSYAELKCAGTSVTFSK